MSALLLALALGGHSFTARADCTADQGSVENIESDGVSVTCDISDPNPFTDGVGSVATNTNLSVVVDEDAEIDAGGNGVNLGNGGNLDNAGSITGSDSAVIGTDLGGAGALTIDNEGALLGTSGAGIDLATTLDDAVISNSGTIEAETFGVRLSGGDIDNSGSITVDGAAAIAIDAGIDSTLTNSGTITSTATGIVDDSGSITNSGTIDATVTALELTGSSLDNSGDIETTGTTGTVITATGASLTNSGSLVGGGAGVNLLGASSLDNSGSLDAVGIGVALEQGGSLDNSGSIASTGDAGIVATGGAIISNSGSVAGSGTAIRLAGGGNTLTLQGGSAVSGSISSALENGGDALVLDGQGSEDSDIETFASLTMRGSSWTLSGAVQALSVDVVSGRLNIDGSLDTRAGAGIPGLVTLSGGELGGLGLITGDVLNSGGSVVANAVGTLTIAGDYTQAAGANLRVASDSGGSVGLLRVEGVADLAGSVTVTAGSDGIYDFLTADGGINGQFDELIVDGRALVTLLSTENTVSFVRASTSVEDNMVHAALDAAVLGLDGLSTGGRFTGESGVWFKGLGHYGERDDGEGVPGSDFTIAGGMLGADWQFGDGSYTFGGGIGYTHTDLDIDDGGDGEADNVVYGVYLEYATERFHGRLTLGGGSNEFEHTRSIFVNDIRRQASADYDGDTLAARLSFGGQIPFRGEWRDTWVFEPEVRADYLVVDMDPYTEDGGTGLELSTEDLEAAEFAGLLHARRKMPDDNGIAARFHLGVTHRIAIDDREWLARDPGSAGGPISSLVLPGDDEDITAFRFGVGADFHFGRHWRATVDYLGEAGDDAESHSLVAGIRRDF